MGESHEGRGVGRSDACVSGLGEEKGWPEERSTTECPAVRGGGGGGREGAIQKSP